MPNPLPLPGALLLAGCFLTACATPERSAPRRTTQDKVIVEKEVRHPVVAPVHRRQDYIDRYCFEQDRFARMSRWHDFPVILRQPPTEKSVVAYTDSAGH